MSDTRFTADLESVYREEREGYNTVVGVLEEVCDAVGIVTQQAVECHVASGFLVNWGQELRVVAKPRGRDFEHILLRCYVPVDGFPVRLDVYDEDLEECGTEESLRESLSAFLREGATADALRLLADQAEEPAKAS